MNDIAQVMQLSPVIPVLVVRDLAQARPLAEALVAGGIRTLEVTLRTPQALEAIQEMKLVPGAVVGAGTVVSAEQLRQVADAGVEFIVSPGIVRRLARAVIESGIPYLPGVATAGDLMRGYELGLRHFKFFPAATSGGLPALKALAAPFYEARFCPTGGINAGNVAEWLAFDPVLCAGGSWVAEGTQSEVEAKARAAVALRAKG